MRPSRLLPLVALLSGAAVFATTLLALDVPGLTRSSAAVVRGTVRSVDARWTRDHARIVTDVVIDVTEPWKGTPGRQVTLMQPGGVVGDVGQLVHGNAKFTPGEDVVVFLEARGDRYLLTGMMQGKFKVQTASNGKAVYAQQELEAEALLVDPATHQPVTPAAVVVPLETLRAQVLAASGATAPIEPAAPGPVKVTP